MKRIWQFIIIVLVLLSAPMSNVWGETVTVTGYYKLFFMGFKTPAIDAGDTTVTEPPIGSVNNRLRLKMVIKPKSWFSFQASYDFSPRIQDPALFAGDMFIGSIDPFSYRVTDFNDRLYPCKHDAVSSFGVFHNLDRFYATFKTSLGDIFVGRQAIAWGSAKFVNPTDVIAPFTFNELDTEERKGVDAIRVRIPIGMMDEIDLGYVVGQDFKFKNSAFFLRGKLYFLKTDLSFLILGFRENLLLGIDIARSIGGAGFWLEAAYVMPDTFAKEDSPTQDKEKDYLRVSVGMDYNFRGKVYGFFEYHFSSAGEAKAANYYNVFETTAFREGSSYLLGKHYLNLGTTFQITPLIPFTGLVIANLNDGSFTVAPSLEYNIAENIYLAAGAYLSIGKKPYVSKLNSEFGAYPHMFYTSFRVYF
jgi:hypothetical protein